MILKRQATRRQEAILGILCLAAALLLTSPLIAWSADEARRGLTEPQPLSEAALSEAEAAIVPPAAAPAVENSPAAPNTPAQSLAVPTTILGQAQLDLNALAQDYSIDDVDNIRWPLVRRSASAGEVYHPDTGVDWAALRPIGQSGTILLPAGFAWSFNETFQRGPGYKDALGVLAGGHCALATAFRAAAAQAGLSTESLPHARPFPGYPLEQTVNIWWGRDDLVVRNTTGQDLVFVWTLSADRLEVTLAPASDSLVSPLPDWRGATVTTVYGHPGPGGWGSLGETVIADHALHSARTFGGRVDEWNGGKPVVVSVNPNIAMLGDVMKRDLYLYYLIAEARRQGYYVMLDVQTGSLPPLPLFESLMDKYLQENVWFDWDIEHTTGGQVDAEQLNQVAAAYFARRQAAGYRTPGLFGFYVFKNSQITNPTAVRRQYDNGVVIPIFDGFGPPAEKIAKTSLIISQFGDGPYGIMEFETRWGTKYDTIPAREYFGALSDTLIMASQ